ncbi:hypothetical protein NDU88_002252 [Pleurodeles waltl]|uniref:Uncharacterized protein n=1 Tax=Pleurodeles waltl TaxID=8319 RepID=A0AAV7SD79_PLEWA|nr:hypothetical protein NDU88_002252 [Pleurodeles waltl]
MGEIPDTHSLGSLSITGAHPVRQNPPQIPTWLLQTEPLLDPQFLENLETCITQYFELNAGSTDCRALEWNLHKVVMRGHCMVTTQKVQWLLQDELLYLQRHLQPMKMQVANRTVPAEQLQQMRRQCHEVESRLSNHDHKRCMAMFHARETVQGTTSSGKLLA